MGTTTHTLILCHYFLFADSVHKVWLQHSEDIQQLYHFCRSDSIKRLRNTSKNRDKLFLRFSKKWAFENSEGKSGES